MYGATRLRNSQTIRTLNPMSSGPSNNPTTIRRPTSHQKRGTWGIAKVTAAAIAAQICSMPWGRPRSARRPAKNEPTRKPAARAVASRLTWARETCI